MGIGLVSGLRLYGTVITIGFGVRLGFIHLDPALSQLELLAHPMILTVATALYVVEFFADKIPWIDTLWDALHTFIRPIGGAALGATAVGSVHPAVQVSCALLCGAVAFSGHSANGWHPRFGQPQS